MFLLGNLIFKILSFRLSTLPAEIDHIINLAVINLTANMIQNLPVSLMKLSNISAIWLSENQHKPLVQLVQDTCPETGQKVLTNFLLPQQDQDQDIDQKSESGSFHALGMISHKMSLITIFGHKHKILNFIKIF